MFGMEFGLFALIGLVLFLWAAINVFQSNTSPMGKAIWIAFLILVPLLSFIVWFFFGPRSNKA